MGAARRGLRSWLADTRPRFSWIAGVVGVALLVATTLSWSVLSGRATPPLLDRDAALDAMGRARAADAEVWVPDAFGEAQAQLDASLTEHRRQELRFISLRDFSGARGGLRHATALAAQAADEATRLGQGARERAQDAVDRAHAVVSQVEGMAASMPAPGSVRSSMVRARRHWIEASLRLDQKEYALAEELAASAIADARTALDRGVTLAGRFIEPDQVQTWLRWIGETVAWSRAHGTAVVVNKERNLLTVYERGKSVRTYHVDLGSNRLNRKLRSGDGATPEGHYYIVSKRGTSRYYKALLLDYPNAADRARLAQLKAAGRVSRGAGLGGSIEIHGEGGRGEDWTRGCVALANRDLDELFGRVGVGTRVTIVGGEGKDGAFSSLVRNLSRSMGSGERAD
jgi:lipoprotein-anchoring transpeptidase ErfK/SrfK